MHIVRLNQMMDLDNTNTYRLPVSASRKLLFGNVFELNTNAYIYVVVVTVAEWTTKIHLWPLPWSTRLNFMCLPFSLIFSSCSFSFRIEFGLGITRILYNTGMLEYFMLMGHLITYNKQRYKVWSLCEDHIGIQFSFRLLCSSLCIYIMINRDYIIVMFRFVGPYRY